jgi:hypothetical protein
MEYCTAKYRAIPPQTYFPGNGLLAGNVFKTQLSNNVCDIEALLFGIGSTNLVTPQAPIVPEIKNLKSLNISNKIPLLIPPHLTIQPNQRPLMD